MFTALSIALHKKFGYFHNFQPRLLTFGANRGIIEEQFPTITLLLSLQALLFVGQCPTNSSTYKICLLNLVRGKPLKPRFIFPLSLKNFCTDFVAVGVQNISRSTSR
jgi:hypothetical protein